MNGSSFEQALVRVRSAKRLRVLRAGLLFFAASLLLTACQAVSPATPLAGGVQPAPLPQPTATPAAQPLRLVILHTNDTWGYLWPCG